MFLNYADYVKTSMLAISMAAKQMKKVAGHLTCPVCYEIYRKPKYLPCYHSYCEECLAKVQRGTNITCPECMQISTVPAGGTRKLPDNFFINRIIDELALQGKVDGVEEVQCDLCVRGDGPAVVLCFNCGEFLCDPCHESHKYSREYRTHSMIRLNELRVEKKFINVLPKPKSLLCQEHEIELNLYCETCDKLMCHYCTTKDHLGHDYDTVKKVANKHRVELDEITRPLEKMIDGLSKAHQDTTSMARELIGNQTAEVDKEIDRFYDQLIQQLLQQRDELKKELQELSVLKIKMASLELEQIEYTQAQLESMKELNIAIKNGSDQEALFMKKQVIKDVKRIQDVYNKLTTEPVELAAMQFIPTEKYHKSLPWLGNLFYGDASPFNSEAKGIPLYAHVSKNVNLLVVTKNAENHLCCKGGSKVMVEAESSAGDIIPVIVVDNKDSSYSVSFVPNQTRKVNLSVTIRGKHIKGSPYSVTVRQCSVLNNPSTIINDKGRMGQPCGIAFGKNGIWAVADQSSYHVYIFDDQDQLIRKFGSEGKCNGQFRFPAGLAFDDNNHLYVVDRYNHRVQKFDIDGKYLLQFNSRPLGNLYYPLGIAVHNSQVFVAEQMNHRISVFRCDGEFSHSIGQFGQLSEPYDVAVTDSNHLLVANHGQHCISIFTLDGNYIGVIGTQGCGRGQLCKPNSVFVDMYGFIFVTEDSNHCVSIFDKDGNFVHSFGSKGSAYGEFCCPVGVALSPNGSVYISDCYNQRIQIFDH